MFRKHVVFQSPNTRIEDESFIVSERGERECRHEWTLTIAKAATSQPPTMTALHSFPTRKHDRAREKARITPHILSYFVLSVGISPPHPSSRPRTASCSIPTITLTGQDRKGEGGAKMQGRVGTAFDTCERDGLGCKTQLRSLSLSRARARSFDGIVAVGPFFRETRCDASVDKHNAQSTSVLRQPPLCDRNIVAD